MAREYKTVRLSCEAKIWINDLILKRNSELQKEIKEGLINDLEDKIFEIEPTALDGISYNLVLKVTNGSVIEQAVRYTKKYSLGKWHEISLKMESAIKELKNVDVVDITPRLYLNKDILEELEELRLKLHSSGDRIPRLSYIIKLVVYAFHCEYISN